MISISETNQQLHALNEAERIHWAQNEFGRRLILTTSFGTYSAVMLHLTKLHAPDTVIISIDTGHNQETRDFAEQLIRQLDLRIDRYRIPVHMPETLSALETPEEYLQRHKVDLLEGALQRHEARAWMSGVQRNETDHRRDFNYLMKRTDGLYKFHPLLDWDTRQLYAYCKKHSLPVNDAYYDPSKGHDPKQECGIHLTGIKADESYNSSSL